MLVEIITHCHSGPDGQYAALLRWHLWSLLKWPPAAVNVLASVCCEPDDAPAIKVVRDAGRKLSAIAIQLHLLPREQLFRRAIGRNQLATRTAADWGWFADCDYVFGHGCLDALAAIPPDRGPLLYPAETRISKDHATGDTYLNRGPKRGINADDFVPKMEGKAIGGIMIVPGDVARRGYLNDSQKWQQPSDKWCFRDDVAFRRSLGTNGEPIDLPNLYRIRHSVAGYE